MPSPALASESPWLDLRSTSPESADLFIYSPIGSLPGAAAATLATLAGLPVKRINVRLNSPGGSVFSGLAVYNALRAHPARVVVYIDGLAASVASAVAMAGDEIRIAANAMLMIHAPSGAAAGGADDMRETAAMLDKVADNLRDIYAQRSGLKREAVAEYMKTDTWFSAEEARAAGLVTHIDAAKTASAHFDLSHFHNVPAVLAGNNNPQNNMPNDTVEGTAPAVEMFTAEAVALQVQSATEAAHASAKVAFDAAAAAHVQALDALRAELGSKIAAKDTELAELAKKLVQAEELSASHIGAAPVASVPGSNGAPAPKTPAEILAHYRELTGAHRSEYFAKHKAEIWAAHDQEMRAAG